MNRHCFRASTRAALAGLGLALLVAGLAVAATPKQVRQQTEASMLLTGSIEIEADGTVRGYGIDHKDKVPDYVLANIDKWVPTWRFSPVLVDGKATPARAKMSLRMAAEPTGDDKFAIYIAGANFGDDSESGSTDSVASRKLKPPVFPRDVINMGGKGTVYLVLKVGRQGTVEDVAVEQVNLTVYSSEQEMKRIRRRLAAASVQRAWEWTFSAPSTGVLAGEEFWSVRVPVDFAYVGDRSVAYGQWEGYLPGPHTRAPWLADEAADKNSDALVSGAVHMVGTGPRLLTPLQEG